MLRRLYDATMALASGRAAEPVLAGVAFAESSFFPLPPDILLIPMVLAEKTKAWRYATLATVSSVLGGLLGYAIGALVFEQLALPLLELYGYSDKFSRFADLYNEWGVWIVLFAGVTPFPFKVITIASGATGLNIVVFVLASVLARGARFFIVAGLLYWIGQPIRNFIEKRLGLMFAAFMVLLIGGFVAVKYIF